MKTYAMCRSGAWCVAASFALVLGGAFTAGAADVVVLKNGTVLEGEILESGNTEVVLNTGVKDVPILRSEIRKLTEDKASRTEFARRFGMVKRSDANAFFELHKWAKWRQGLFEWIDIEGHLLIGVDPAHGVEHGCKGSARHQGFEAEFAHLLQTACLSDRRVRAGAATEGAGPLRTEGAVIILSDDAAAAAVNGLDDLRLMSCGDEHDKLHVGAQALRQENLGVAESQLGGEGRPCAFGGLVEICVRRNERQPRSRHGERKTAHQLFLKEALDRQKKERVMHEHGVTPAPPGLAE